jgi:hypothetical protein
MRFPIHGCRVVINRRDDEKVMPAKSAQVIRLGSYHKGCVGRRTVLRHTLGVNKTLGRDGN